MDYTDNWETLIETVQDGLMIVDTQGSIVAVNTSAEKMTGYSKEELVGSSCRILNCTGCKMGGQEDGSWCGLFRKKKVTAKRCTITGKNSRNIYVLKNASVMKDKDGRAIGAVEILTDISENIRQQEKISRLRNKLQFEGGYHDLLGNSAIMQQLFELIENVAQSDAPVMIQGQSGTGKELVAMAIHEASPRCDESFIKVNCAALNENLLESELFGHVKGAYTGAERSRVGRFEAANGGSIFLDEIGDIPMSTQVKLLRVLQENVIERVGDQRPIPIDVRIITATNKNLEKLTEAGHFREDLFFRISVFPLDVPSLSCRTEDIPILAQNFIQDIAQKSKKRIDGLTPEALKLLMRYNWPGNVRELRNAMEYALVLCPSGRINTGHLPPKITHYIERANQATGSSKPFFRQERENLIDVLRKTNGNQSEAAKILQVSRVTIWKRIKKYNIDLQTDLDPI